MPEAANEGWQELQVPSRRQCPKLFYSFTTQDESLTLLITDLISIWECELDKYDILSHAARQHASIDPSVSSDQFDILLSKIGKSLKDGDNVLLRQDVRNSSLLMLRTKSDLPKPLRPLEWTFKLTPRDASELAERILRPSLHEVAVSGEKIKSLLRIIKEKDHVISRLLDRVGSASIDLGLIFPGITGMASRKSGQVSVADAKKHVPGMAGFDEKSWIKQFSNDEGYEGADCTGLSNLVRGNEKCFAHTKSEHEDWIRELSTSDKASPELDRSNARSNNDQSKPSAKESTRRQAKSDDESTNSDNDFERQPTPPELQHKPPSKNKTTQDDAKEETPPPKPKPKPHKIGSLGRRSATKSFGAANSKSKSPTPAEKDNDPKPQRRTSDASDATATASEDEEDDDKIISGARSSQRNRTNEASTPNEKVGGLRKKPTTNQSPSPSPAPPSRPATRQHPSQTPDENEDEDSDLDLDRDHPPIRSPSAPTPSRHRLGRVGRKATASPSKSDAPSPPKPAQDRTSEAPSQTTPKRRLGRLGARKNQDKEESPSSNKKPTPKTKRSHQSDNDDTSSPSPSPTTRKKLASQRTKPSQTAKSEPQSSPPMPDSATAPPAEEPEPEKEETAEEIANRRRMELKRTIASNAGAKKKRRF